MSWIAGCMTNTKAGKRYQRNVMITMSIYILLVFGAALIVKHGHPHGWLLYLCALAPAVPVIFVLILMGKYLQEETDEFIRLQTMRALLVATGALMGMIVVSDFLRSFTGAGALPPFWLFVTFFVAFGLVQAVQRLQNRAGSDD